MDQLTRPLLFLPIETKVREYHAKLFFSLLAVENGFDVLLGPQREIQKQVYSNRSGIYIDKSITYRKIKHFRRLKKIGNLVTAWDEEGLAFFDRAMYQKLRVREEAFEDVELFFAWGEFQKESIVRMIPTGENKILCTGNPRIDVLRPEVRGFYADLAGKLNKQYGKILLINTNFGFYNNFHGQDAALAAQKRYYTSSEEIAFTQGLIELQEKMFHFFLQMIEKLSKEFTSYTILVRPHPSENFTRWDEVTESLSNVTVSGDGSVLEWIMASEALIHFNCTTAIESFLMGVPAYAVLPFEIGQYKQILPNGVSCRIRTIEELIERIHTLIQNVTPEKSYNNEPKKVAAQFMSNMDGAFGSEKIIEALKNLVSGQNEGIGVKEKCWKQVWRGWSNLRSMKEKLFNQKDYGNHKFPGLSHEELKETISSFQKVTGRFESVRTQSTREDCYCLTVKD